MQHLCLSSRRHQSISGKFSACQGQVRFFALLHKPCSTACGPPSVLSFNLAYSRRSTYRVSCATMISRIPTAGRHRLRRGLPGYLILLLPRFRTSVSVSVQVVAFATGVLYLRISPLQEFHLPYSSSVVWMQFQVEPGDFIQLLNHLRALRPVIPINACPFVLPLLARISRCLFCW